MNDHGFMALMDAMLFITVILVAASVMLTFVGGHDTDDRNASRFLEDVLSSEVRLSDMSDGDDSLVRLSDIMAFHLQTGEEGPIVYLGEILDAFSAGRGYLFTMRFDSGEDIFEESIGFGGRMVSSFATQTVQISTGGILSVSITLYRS